MAAGDFPSWYPAYRELRNRSDSGGRLTPAEQGQLDDYETRLRLEADALSEVGSQARQVDESIGDSTVASQITPSLPSRDDLPPYDEQVKSILDEPGTKELGFTKKTLTGMGPAAVGRLYTEMFPSSPAGGGGGGGPPSINQPQQGETGDSGDESAAGGDGSGLAGPWALEATTQSRLIEIREAISKLGNGKQVTGQGEGDEDDKDKSPSLHKVLRGEALNALDLMSFPGAGRNKSGQNLASYTKMIRGTGLRAAEKLGRVFPKTAKGLGRVGEFLGFSSPEKKAKSDEESNDQSKPRLDPRVVVGAVEGAEAGAAAGGPAGAAVGAVAGAASAAGGSSSAGGAAGVGSPSVAAAGGGSSVGGVAGGVTGTAAAGGETAAAGGLAAAGAATAGLAVLAVAAFEAGKATYQFARAQEAEIRKLSEFGAQQSIGLAQLDAHRIGRDVRTAQETGDSSQSLTKSIDAFEEKLQPIESLLTNIANTVGGRVLDMITQILTPLSEGAKVVGMIYDALPSAWKKDQREDEIPFDRLKQLAEETMRQNVARFPVGGPNNPRANGGMF